MAYLSRLFQLLSEADLFSKEISLDRNEFLKVKGNHEDHIYFVKSGSLRIYIVDEVEEHTIRFGYEGNMITALDSFIHGGPTEFFIQALRKTELQAADRAAYQKFIREDKEASELWNEMLMQFVLEQMEREKDLLISSPQERYRRVWERSPKLFQEIPSKYIASYLRMTPETLSRIRKS